MVAILETPAIRHQVKPFSVTAYEQMGEKIFGHRTELIRGAILEKMPGSPLHVFLIARLRAFILGILDSGLCYREEKPLKLADSMPEPDLAVVSGQDEMYLHAHPATALLTVEVALSSLELDREKAVLYAEAGVREYWIVLGKEKAVEVYLDPQDGRYTRQRRYTRDETIHSAALPALAVNLAALFPSD